MQKKKNDAVDLDFLKLIRLLWSKVIWILLAAAFLGTAGYCFARFFVAPTYQTDTWYYVNNNAISASDSNYSISTGQLSGARSLVDTYAVVLSSRSTLEEVARTANLPYSAGQLKRMVSCSSVNGTEMFSVTVTTNNPDEALLISETIADVLPVRISDIVDNSSVRIVDAPQRPGGRSGPNYSRYAIIGAVIGAVAAAVIIFLVDYFDDVIHSDDYLTATYSIPILSRIPNLDMASENESYYSKDGYYAKEKEE